MDDAQPESGKRSGSSWFDRNVLYLWACLQGGYGISLSWSNLKSPPGDAVSYPNYLDGGVLVLGSLGLLFAARWIDQLRERVEEVEAKADARFEQVTR
jgi:hypothetical protein